MNENQRQAVIWDQGPLLVIAGPGSGKTRVLTSRIGYILEQSQNQYFRLLGLTFTNKAAAEMRGRLELLVPRELARVRLTTFHSFAAELLSQHGNHVQIRSDFSILSNDSDREALLNDVLIDLRKDLNTQLPEYYSSSQILPVITKLTELCIHPQQSEIYLQDANFENAIALAKVYSVYREALKRANFLDFPSLIAETIDLLTKFPFISKQIRKIYKHILVDEFQETNASQYQVLTMIANPHPST
jgi:DNA helicase-2/ATP-dependent DNA helicase PcrA